MKLGMFMMPVHPLHRNHTETLKEDREAVILADKLGFHDVFVVMAAVSLGGVWLAALRDPAAAQPPVARTRPTSTRRTCG